MSGNEVSCMARLTAERIMRGEKISDGEMRMVVAGLLLQGDKLASGMEATQNSLTQTQTALEDMRGSLWSEERLRQIIGGQIQTHCRAAKQACAAPAVDSASWIGRLLRTFLGR